MLNALSRISCCATQRVATVAGLASGVYKQTASRRATAALIFPADSLNKRHKLHGAIEHINKVAQTSAELPPQVASPNIQATETASTETSKLIPHIAGAINKHQGIFRPIKRMCSININTKAWLRLGTRNSKRYPTASLQRIVITPYNTRTIARLLCTSSPQGNPPEKYSAVLKRRMREFGKRLRSFVGLRKPYTSDQFLPLAWFLGVLLAVGVVYKTAPLVSGIVWIVNKNEQWRESFANYLSRTLTTKTGIDIKFEKVTGSWREGKLKLENVTIVRDPKNFPEGWIRELQASGIKGVIDQRALDWSGPPPPRRPWKRGDFVLERLFLSGADISLYQPYPDRELKIQLYVLDCDMVRQHWLLHDLLAAKSIYGTFDGSLFSVTRTYVDDDRIKNTLKVASLKTDLITSAAVGPLSWITDGTVDVECELDFNPDHLESEELAKWLQEPLSITEIAPQTPQIPSDLEQRSPGLLFSVSLKLNNLRAAVPPRPAELTWFHQALVRPVVAYMNTNYTCIPLDFKIFLKINQFAGAYTPWEAGVWDALSVAVANSFLELIKEQRRPSALPRHLLHVMKSIQRGAQFIMNQIHGYFWLWYFNNDDETEEGERTAPPQIEVFANIPNSSVV